MNNNSPQRIISLVPSISELLWDLGLQQQLVGITKFCIHPDEMYKSVSRVGGTKNVDIEKIKSLNPDLIIANKEENTKEQMEALQREFNVHITDVNTFDDAIKMISDLGILTGKSFESQKMIHLINRNFESLNKISERKRVIYLIWKNPIMAVGTESFIHSMLLKVGFENCILQSRYPELDLKEIYQLNPDYLFLSTEPFPFSDKDKTDFGEINPKKIILVDGEMFSWYGSRLINAPAYFISLIRQLQQCQIP